MAEQGDLINLTISSNVQDFKSIRRFPCTITIGELKNKLELLTGVLASNMQLELRNTDEKFVGILSDDRGSCRIHKLHSVRAWKQREKLGRFNPEAQKAQEEREAKLLEIAERMAKSLKVGQRCEVRVANQSARRGCVAFVGTTKFKPGYWAGIRFDEPVGKNDGTVNGEKYFQCPSKYGGFVRPQDVVVGDFPELGLDDMDEI